ISCKRPFEFLDVALAIRIAPGADSGNFGDRLNIGVVKNRPQKVSFNCFTTTIYREILKGHGPMEVLVDHKPHITSTKTFVAVNGRKRQHRNNHNEYKCYPSPPTHSESTHFKCRLRPAEQPQNRHQVYDIEILFRRMGKVPRHQKTQKNI